MANPPNRGKEIEITIPADGSEPIIEMIGYEGTDCSFDAKEIISTLGAKDIQATRKPEYFKVKNKNQLKTRK
jgi:hypothetical protein